MHLNNQIKNLTRILKRKKIKDDHDNLIFTTVTVDDVKEDIKEEVIKDQKIIKNNGFH